MKKLSSRIRKTYCAWLFAVVLLGGCPVSGIMVTPQPPTVVDQDKCQAACDNLKRLGCEEAEPIDMHASCFGDAECLPGQTCSTFGTCVASCVSFCVDTENQGVWLDPGCVANVKTCDQVDSCPLPTSR